MGEDALKAYKYYLKANELDQLPDEKGKVKPNKIYGGKIVENLCQSYAFMMLGWQACRMADRGISLKANIHDAWITVVPEEKAEETKRIMEEVMSSVPSWLEGFPVGCEAEIGDDFRIA